MSVANCPRCGKVFMRSAKNLCPDCIRENELMYEKVYRYLCDNPRSTVMQVVEATDVSEDRILAYLREGRIQAAEWLNLQYPCERCGGMISSGRFCEKCSREVNDSLKDLADQIQSATQNSAEKQRFGYHIEGRLKR